MELSIFISPNETSNGNVPEAHKIKRQLRGLENKTRANRKIGEGRVRKRDLERDIQ